MQNNELAADGKHPRSSSATDETNNKFKFDMKLPPLLLPFSRFEPPFNIACGWWVGSWYYIRQRMIEHSSFDRHHFSFDTQGHRVDKEEKEKGAEDAAPA